jgi:hypothetical protein
MQTLIFNTTKRTVELFSDMSGLNSYNGKNTPIYKFDNIPTVRVMTEGFYEVIQEEGTSKFPILRIPICNTNMIIEK